MSTENLLPNAQTEQGLPATANTSIIAIQEMFSMLLKKWWIFLIVGVLAGLAGIWYASTQKPVYKSRLTFALDEGGDGGMSGAFSLAAQLGLSIGDNKSIFSGDNILQILTSRRMVERVLLSVDTFNNKPYTLIGYYLEKKEKNDDKSKEVAFPPGQERSSFSYLQDSVLYNVYFGFVATNITAGRPDKKLSIYEVNVTTPYEKLTKVFTDRLVNETNSFYIELSSKKSKQTLQVLEDRLAAMKGGLNSSISNRASSLDANLNPTFAASQVPVLKQQVNMQVYSEAYAEMLKTLEMARYQYLNKLPLMQIIDSADYPMKKVKMSKLFTGLAFSFISALIIVFIFWLRRILKSK